MDFSNYFSKDNVNDISNQIFRTGKYYGSDFESDEEIHYDEGHGLDYHENDESEIKNQTKKNQKS